MTPMSRSNDYLKPVTPAPTPAQPEVQPEKPIEFLGPVRSLPVSTGRTGTLPAFGGAASDVDAVFDAERAAREKAAQDAFQNPALLHKRLDDAVRAGNLSREEASAYWTARFPG